jgi:hypothetical protein
MSAWNWSVGVTTAGRLQLTLDRMLSSLFETGWERPRLFADADAVIPQQWAHLPATRRDVQLGAFPNWLLGLAELVLREPHADAYLICQDDAVFCRGLPAYLEQAFWPAERLGVVSLYCPSHVGKGQLPGFHPFDGGWDTWGAQAFVFPPASARAFLTDPISYEHRCVGPNNGLRNIDSIVGQWCREAQRPFFIHVPSLAQHIGETSTLYGGVSLLGKRSASDFPGEEADAGQQFITNR